MTNNVTNVMTSTVTTTVTDTGQADHRVSELTRARRHRAANLGPSPLLTGARPGLDGYMKPATINLTTDECWSLLRRHNVARLAVDIAGQPDIFPLNYVVDNDSLVFRSGAGTKLAGAILGRHVAFEIDGADEHDRSVWSVVVKGLAHEVEGMQERFAIEDLPLYPWIASDKPNFVRIEPRLVTGRRFNVVDGTDMATPDRSGEHHPGEPQLRPG